MGRDQTQDKSTCTSTFFLPKLRLFIKGTGDIFYVGTCFADL